MSSVLLKNKKKEGATVMSYRRVQFNKPSQFQIF